MIYRHTLDMLVATWPTNCHLRTTQRRRLVPGRRYAFDAMRPMPSLDRTCPGRPPTLLGSTTPYVIALHRHVTTPLRTNHLRVGLASSWPIYSRCHHHHPHHLGDADATVTGQALRHRCRPYSLGARRHSRLRRRFRPDRPRRRMRCPAVAPDGRHRRPLRWAFSTAATLVRSSGPWWTLPSPGGRRATLFVTGVRRGKWASVLLLTVFAVGSPPSVGLLGEGRYVVT